MDVYDYLALWMFACVCWLLYIVVSAILPPLRIPKKKPVATESMPVIAGGEISGGDLVEIRDGKAYRA